MPSSFTLKTIRLVITLGKGQFSEGGNTKTIEGLACEVSVTKPGLPEKNSAQIKVWGLKYTDMEQLTMLAFRPLESQKNMISVFAGEIDKDLSLVYAGDITSSFADFNSSPDIPMQFECETGTYAQQIAEPNLTVAVGKDGEPTAVADLFAKFAASAGYAFENQGVTTSTKNICVPGSPVSKAEKLSRDVNCNLLIDDDTMIISPPGQARTGNAVLLTKDTGMIGYPTFSQDGIQVKCIYNPDLAYNGLVQIDSIVPRASGVWRITKLTHNISAYVPGGGEWMSEIEAKFYE